MSYFPRSIHFIRFNEVVWPGGMEYIPSPLEEAVLEAVERVANRFSIHLDGSDENSYAIQEAVENGLSPMQLCLDWAEERHRYARIARKEGRLYAAVSGELFSKPEYEDEDELILESLAVYQLDQLIGATRARDITSILHISADLFEIQKLLGRREKVREAKDIAASRAKKRHQEMNEKRKQIVEDWSLNYGEYESRADYARIMSDITSIKYRTIYEWIAAHEKSIEED